MCVCVCVCVWVGVKGVGGVDQCGVRICPMYPEDHLPDCLSVTIHVLCAVFCSKYASVCANCHTSISFEIPLSDSL